jgi:CheY-like chemotaxis protein
LWVQGTDVPERTAVSDDGSALRVEVTIGPLAAASVTAWAHTAERTVHALREQPELGVPGDVIAAFEQYVIEFRDLAARSSTFQWTGEVDVAEVRRLASYWALLANMARTTDHPTGVEPAPAISQPFYDALVVAMAEVVAARDPEHFAERFEEVVPSFDAEVDTPVRAGRARVLLVDDTEDMRMLLRIALQMQSDFEVYAEATNGQEALDAVADGCPDAILLDVMMPVMDGLTALPLLVERCPRSRIVIVTTMVTKQLREQALALGAHAVVDKQEPMDELRRILSTP